MSKRRPVTPETPSEPQVKPRRLAPGEMLEDASDFATLPPGASFEAIAPPRGETATAPRETVRIKLLTVIASPAFTGSAGAVVEIGAAQAREFIRQGLAVEQP